MELTPVMESLFNDISRDEFTGIELVIGDAGVEHLPNKYSLLSNCVVTDDPK